MAPKIEKIVRLDPANAKPTAVPRKGAVHGVASATARVPSKKLRTGEWAASASAAIAGPDGWKVISKIPNRFIANTTSSVQIAAMKIGSWNWKPQPTEVPAARSPDDHGREREHRCEDAAEIRETVLDDAPALEVREVRDREHLQREDGQHARHQVQDQPTEEREQDRGRQ